MVGYTAGVDAPDPPSPDPPAVVRGAAVREADPAAVGPSGHVYDEDDRAMIRLQSGDASAFDELVARHGGPLLGFFLKNTRDRAHAEDLTQETLLKVYRRHWDYLPLGRFRGWMYRIGRNLLIDAARKNSRDTLFRSVRGAADADIDPLDTVAGPAESPLALADRKLFAELVDELLSELPADQRETFTLHHFSHVPLPEVGQAMGVTTSTAKSRLRLAREKLRAKLADRGVHDPFGGGDGGGGDDGGGDDEDDP